MRRENSDEDLSSDPILDQMKSAFGEKLVDQVCETSGSFLGAKCLPDAPAGRHDVTRVLYAVPQHAFSFVNCLANYLTWERIPTTKNEAAVMYNLTLGEQVGTSVDMPLLRKRDAARTVLRMELRNLLLEQKDVFKRMGELVQPFLDAQREKGQDMSIDDFETWMEQHETSEKYKSFVDMLWKSLDAHLARDPPFDPIVHKMVAGTWTEEDDLCLFSLKKEQVRNLVMTEPARKAEQNEPHDLETPQGREEKEADGPTRGELAINELKKKLEQNVLRDIEILQKRMVKQQRQVRKKTRRRICLICANPLQLSACQKLSCKHAFHATCIRTWHRYFKTCPICYPPPPVK